MSNRCLYNTTFRQFIDTVPKAILGTLHLNYHGDALTTTDDAWIGEKAKAEVRAFYEEFERLHPAENYPALSERETIEYNIRRNATYLNEENIRFILEYYDSSNHLPMFYMVSAYFENSTWRKLQIIREYLGLFGERKTKEQLMEKYQLSKSTINDELNWVDHSIRRAVREIEKDITT